MVLLNLDPRGVSVVDVKLFPVVSVVDVTLARREVRVRVGIDIVGPHCL